MPRTPLAIAFPLLALLIIVRPAPAAPQADGVAALLDRVTAAYEKIESLQLEAIVEAEYVAAGRNTKHEARYTAALAADGRFRHEVPGQLTVAGAAEAVYVYLPASLRYYRSARTAEAPGELGPAARRALVDHNLSLWLALAPNAGEAIRQLGALEATDDPAALRLVRNDKSAWQLSFDPQTWLLREIVIDERPTLEAAGVPAVERAERRIRYTRADTGGNVADDAVAFAPPEQAQEVEPASLGGGAGLAGQPAPALSLPDLEGNVVSLEALRGKVVLVDFWASWCGPCIRGLPHIKTLAAERGSAGLVVLAVNLRENEQTIRQFIAEHELAADALRVLHDADGKAGDAWGVTGIPFTAVIGRDGVVREVIVGLSPEKVSQAVEAALAE